MNKQLQDLVMRVEETGGERDSIGNFEAQHIDRRWESPLYYPIVNQQIIQHDPTWLTKISWPNGKKFAACLTHDVDSVQINSRFELSRTIAEHLRQATSGTERLKHAWSVVGLRKKPKKIDVFWPWVELERRYGFRSSFFFSATVVSRRHVRDNAYRWDDRIPYRGSSSSVAEVARDLYKEGWDVGLHGSFLSAIDYDLLAEQKQDLERALGVEVLTTRQHNLRFDAKITPRIHARAGFKVDSTLGFNRDIGFRAGIAYPFRQWDLEEQQWLGVFQVPLILHDGAILRRDNLDLDETHAFRICKTMIDRVAATKGVITLLWHPNMLIHPSWWNLYECLLSYIHEQNGWGASLRDIYHWWVSQGFDKELEKVLC